MEKHKYENKMYPRPPARALVYVGEGARVGNAPRRDLTLEEAAQYGGIEHLLATGLYATPEELQREMQKGK